VAALYGELLDGFVADERIDGAPAPVLVTDVELGTARQRARLAGEVLTFARSLV
jgi:hypothetical protein